MLFNSLEFLFVLFPTTLAAYYIVRARVGHDAALLVLTIASLVFYGWWNVSYLPLLVFSAVANFYVGAAIARTGRRAWMILGVTLNLFLIGLFKYADFLLGNVNALTGAELPLPAFALPLAISFFTFQQIAFLVDVYAGRTKPDTLLRHLLFVAFFPQLIAGPIVAHRLMGPQLADAGRKDDLWDNLGVGMSMFAIGLAKKVLIADNIEPFATTAFEAAARGQDLGLLEAWSGALAYSLQIFFDFSGYSDMALGLGRVFGFRLPANFNAPYRATSVIDFWRRWHITLSRFLRDYLYIPLGGSRRGGVRRAVNLMIVMLLGGLWHGAAWTFVIWGGLHGLGLAWCHLLNKMRPHGLFPRARWLAVAATFLFVTVAWVFFRADSFASAGAMLSAMAGLNGLGGGIGDEPIIAIVIGLAIVWGLPDTISIFHRHLDETTLETARIEPQKGWRWRPGPLTGAGLAFVLFLTIINAWRTSEFIYYTF